MAEKLTEVRLTTVDNPFDPFTEWDDWYFYDLQNGYNTCERIASITILSDQLSNQENVDSEEDAMDEIIKTGAINKKGEIIEYKKVFKETNKI